MDEFEKIMQEAERESLQVNQALAKMLLDMWKNANGEVRTCTKRARQMLVAAILAAVLAVAAIIGCLCLGAEVVTDRAANCGPYIGFWKTAW